MRLRNEHAHGQGNRNTGNFQTQLSTKRQKGKKDVSRNAPRKSRAMSHAVIFPSGVRATIHRSPFALDPLCLLVRLDWQWMPP